MSKFDAKIGIGDGIYACSHTGYKYLYIVGEVLFSSRGIQYRTHCSDVICFEHDLDDIHNHPMIYFSSKVKRDTYIESLNVNERMKSE